MEGLCVVSGCQSAFGADRMRLDDSSFQLELVLWRVLRMPDFRQQVIFLLFSPLLSCTFSVIVGQMWEHQGICRL